MAERLITLARQGTLNSRRRVISMMRDRRLVDENQDFIEEGPTRTIVQSCLTISRRASRTAPAGIHASSRPPSTALATAASIVLLQLLTEKSEPRGTARRSAGLRRKRNERRHQFATKVLKEGKATAKAETKAAEGESPKAE
jgi:hypothetical protein